MAYKKTNWQDTLRDAQGNVIQKGTPLNAQALGKIEEGIVAAEQKIDAEIQQVTTQLAQNTQNLFNIALHMGQYGSITNVDDTSLLQSIIDAGYTNIIIPSCVINSVTFKDDTDYTLTFLGASKHKSGATGDMFISGTNTGFTIIGANASLDGQFTLQTNKVSIFNMTNAKYVKFGKVEFKNIKSKAIIGRSSNFDLLHVEDCRFRDAALHTGVIGEGTGFISVFGGSLNIFKNCRFIQTANPLANQNRNPSGIFISGQNGEKVVEVDNCYFENLGHNVAGNLESPLDIYSFAKKVTFENNTFVKSRFNPFRVTNAEIANIKRNDVLQDVAIINDGGGDYADASCFNCGIVGRGYAVNLRDNLLYNLEDNTFKVVGVNCKAVVTSNDSTAYKVERMVFKNNNFTSTGANTQTGILLNKIKDVVVYNLNLSGFTGGIRAQNTNIDALSSLIASLVIKDSDIASNGIGVSCRDFITNLNVTIDGVNFYNNTGVFSFTIRNAKNVSIRHIVQPTTNTGDVATNAVFYYYNNDNSKRNADPAGYNTNTYYRLYNNPGRPDVASA